MITINVIDDQICGSYGETPFAVEYTKEVYDIMQQHAVMAEQVETVEEYNKIMEDFARLTIVDYTKTIGTKCEHIHVNTTGEFFLKHNGVVSSIPMPQALVDRIFESIDKELSFDPLVKMWTRWLRNPILRRKMKQGHGEDFCNRFFNFVNMNYVHPKHKEDLMENSGLSEEAATKRATMY